MPIKTNITRNTLLIIIDQLSTDRTEVSDHVLLATHSFEEREVAP